ncbi:hypothetical protein B0H13DRAFT_2459161 [Mycena leptocephala]|nr:hypothetical protein B0H13DRAFT_2459161 [Mycena leptocephala]
MGAMGYYGTMAHLWFGYGFPDEAADQRLFSLSRDSGNTSCADSSTSSSVRTVTQTRTEKRGAILIELAIGIPPLQIPLRASLYRSPSNPNPELDAHAECIVQGHRDNIFEDIGCLGGTYETPLPSLSSTFPPSSSALSPQSTVVRLLPLFPSLFPLLHPTHAHIFPVLCFFVVLSIKSLAHYHSQFRLLLSASAHANLSLNRCIRLMALASTDLLLTSMDLLGRHAFKFLAVVQVPGIYWRADPYSVASVETLWWAMVACALLFFAPSLNVCGGLGVGAQFDWRNIQIPPLLLPRRIRNPPVFIRKDTTQKWESFDSFPNMSASYGGISTLEYDAEKTWLWASIMRARVSDYSSSPSSSSSVSSSISSDTESVGGEQEGEIEVSSLHRVSVHIPTTLSISKPAHTWSSGPDVPMPPTPAGCFAKEGPVDIYWDNVSGDILDSALEFVAPHGQFLHCGAISGYNTGHQSPKARVIPPNFHPINANALHVRGIVMAHLPVMQYLPGFNVTIPKKLASGEIKYAEEVTRGLEKVGR